MGELNAWSDETRGVDPQGRIWCRTCQRERDVRRQARARVAVQPHRQPTDPALVDAYHAAYQAGTLDALLRARIVPPSVSD